MASLRTLTTTRESLIARLADARRETDRMFELLRPEALFDRPVPERHRLIFYLGHVEAFDWNLVAKTGFGVAPFEERFDRLFAFGIDPVDGGLPSEPPAAWPSEADVRGYGARTREVVDACLERADFEDATKEHARMFGTAIEHRLMHAETLAYLLHNLPASAKRAPGPAAGVPARSSVRPHVVRVPAGRATLGAPRDGRFGWDNEFDAHVVDVPAFGIDALDVTNGQYLEFVRDGGYENDALWDAEHHAWRAGMRHPLFWRRTDDGWVWRGMFGERPLPLDAPVWVSHAEAQAYARWKGRRLPTEAEFHRAAYGTPDGGEREYPWGDTPPEPRHGNFDLQHWDPTPAGAHPDGRSAFGAYDLLGNGWEWTSTVFAPFAGFDVYPPYRGYSADFFDGHHVVMKGGSPRTAACMLRRSFRNWFQPRYPYVFAAFRLVEP